MCELEEKINRKFEEKKFGLEEFVKKKKFEEISNLTFYDGVILTWDLIN